MILAGPCLINNTKEEKLNALQTARELKQIDPSIMFRSKLWGGGLTPEIYFPGIGVDGFELLNLIRGMGLKTGTEIQCESRLDIVAANCDFIWTAARAMQSYGFLEKIGRIANKFSFVVIKRHFGVTEEETWGIHDICVKRHMFKPIICERGINTYDRAGARKWMPDYRFMERTRRLRPDIELMFDPSHALGEADAIMAHVKATRALDIRHYMLEVYDNKKLTQSDREQALSIDEFKQIYSEVVK